MATVQYNENTAVRSGLQADTRDLKARETERAKVKVYDILIDVISALPVNHGTIKDNQGYYSPTIERKSAYHGAFLKYFGLFGDFSLIIGGSLDHQYPLEVFLTYRGLLVKCLYSFKSSSRALTNNLLPAKDMLTEKLAGELSQVDYSQVAEKIDDLLKSPITFSKHWRKFKKECAGVMEYLSI